MGKKTGLTAAATPPLAPTLTGLPPDVVTRVFAQLAVADLGRVARTARRAKVLAYSDDVYLPRLRALDVLCSNATAGTASSSAAASTHNNNTNANYSNSSSTNAESNFDTNDPAVATLATRLKMLPGGLSLGNTTYLQTGSLFAHSNADSFSFSSTTSVTSSTSNNSAFNPNDYHNHTSNNSSSSISISKSVQSPSDSLSPASTTAQSATDIDVSNPTTAASSPSSKNKISPTLPQMKKSNIVIGAGGLKAAGKSSSAISIGGGGSNNAANNRSKSPSSLSRNQKQSTTKLTAHSTSIKVNHMKYYPHLKNLRPREAFKQIFLELRPYYLDFRTHSKDSKVFRDHSNLSQVSTLLARLTRFASASLISNCDDVNLALETTIEWFESMLLGQFERAYDAKDLSEMRRNASAAFELNDGHAAVVLFCAKNPIFFDQAFNPSLVAAKLPNIITSTAEARGYALADDFAQFMEHTLDSCTIQAKIVAQVFVPEMDAMTWFVSKVFEDSISEYLTAVLTAARDGEGVAIYLHTLATSVHCCDQFLGLVAIADPKVQIRTNVIRNAMKNIFEKDWAKYVDVEMEHLGRRIDAELKKWNTRKERSNPSSPNGPAAFLTDAESSMAHKREVMSVFKKVLFAPYAIGKTVGNAIMGTRGKGQLESLLGDEESFDSGGSNFATASTPTRGSPTYDKFPSPVISTPKDSAVTYHLDDGSLGSLVSLELCLNLMHMSKESLGRILVITNTLENSQLKANAGKVFVRLLQGIGEGHMNPAFYMAISRLEKSKPVNDWSEKTVNIDSLQFFELVHIADLVHQMLDVYFAEDVRPWIDENDFLSDVMVEKKAFDRQSDDNVAHGMDKAIQVLITQVDFILETTQKPTDYNPANDDGVYDFKPTKACLDAIACLNAHTKLLNGVTNKDTLEVFFGEVGIRLFNVICKNLKKQQVSQSGALQLICDMNKYHEWATTLRVASVTRLFNVLKELGSLFMADGGEELRNLVHDTERYQGALRPEEIYELLASRTDYKKIQKFVEAKECIVM
ncbi:F-box protein: endocytic membrane traffic, recycling ReCYcling 1 [Physocladia obscura]|uniref:F-box protein: endocytic membrane traffic, recycling ReCYcling 1 n=1 Tax=Physocladia obscura TaxID=109957 RepID=A0AAD5T1I0_9FUNG|nr:F-box protein: endocytic membrane traffic, recycling ReCYcling 1 [Physocladia obscura]